MKAVELYFPGVLFIMMYKVVLTFESVDEILKCDLSNKNCVYFMKYFKFITVSMWLVLLWKC